MLYPFMTLPDETEIVHSESILSGDKETVKVCIEKPVDYGFKSALKLSNLNLTNLKLSVLDLIRCLF